MKIDCAQNNAPAEELVGFLQEKGHSVSQEEALVTTNEKIPLDILELFLEKQTGASTKLHLLIQIPI